MIIRFQTLRQDFPPNVEDLKIQHVVLYFARKHAAMFEVPVTHLRFTEQGGVGTVGGGATSIDGIISINFNLQSNLSKKLLSTPIVSFSCTLSKGRFS